MYSRGDREVGIYFLAEGRVKLTQRTTAGVECTTGLYVTGELFGEMCLSPSEARLDSGIALCDSVVARMPAYAFLSKVQDAGLLDGLLQYFAVRLAEQQATIAMLLTSNAEQRLAYALAMLSRRLGVPAGLGHRSTPALKHEELADLVGTTRSRVGLFLKGFRERGFVETGPDAALIVHEQDLVAFADALAREPRDPAVATARPPTAKGRRPQRPGYSALEAAFKTDVTRARPAAASRGQGSVRRATSQDLAGPPATPRRRPGGES